MRNYVCQCVRFWLTLAVIYFAVIVVYHGLSGTWRWLACKQCPACHN